MRADNYPKTTVSTMNALENIIIIKSGYLVMKFLIFWVLALSYRINFFASTEVSHNLLKPLIIFNNWIDFRIFLIHVIQWRIQYVNYFGLILLMVFSFKCFKLIFSLKIRQVFRKVKEEQVYILAKIL